MASRPHAFLLALAAAVFPAPAARYAHAVPSSPTVASIDTIGAALADSLRALRGLLDERRFPEAASQARRLLPSVETTFTSDSLALVRALDRMLEAFWRGGGRVDPRWLELAERSVRVRERMLGRTHPEVAVGLTGLGRLLRGQQRTQEARLALERAAAIFDARDTSSAELPGTLTSLASIYRQIDDLPRARALNERALRLREAALGPQHPEVALNLHNLALVLRYMGEYEAARSYRERAVAIFESLPETYALDLAETSSEFGVLLSHLGEYDAAQHQGERAVAIRERILGPRDPRVADALDNLGLHYQDGGRYIEARRCQERALEIRLERLSSDHPRLANSYVNLGELFRKAGDYSTALAFHERALGTLRRQPEPDHHAIATVLYDIGRVRQDMMDLTGAKSYFDSSLVVHERRSPPDELGVARALTSLGTALCDLGELAAARPPLERALRMREAALGRDHVGVAGYLGNLASLLRAEGDLRAARDTLDRVLRIYERTLGAGHPAVAAEIALMAAMELDAGDRDAAFRHALRAEGSGREHLSLTLQTLPERQALRYGAVRATGLDIVLSVASDGAADSGRVVAAWDALIRSRSLVLDEMAERHRAVMAARDPEVVRLWKAFEASRQRLANLTVREPDDPPTTEYIRVLDSARREAEAAERVLADRSVAFRQQLSQGRAGLAEITSGLPAGTALVAYARYGDYPIGVQRAAARVPSYAVFVLRPGESRPRLVALGSAHVIDSLVARWREDAAHPPQEEWSTAREALSRRIGVELRKRVWDPVASLVQGARLVLVVPDGSIQLANIAALPAGETKYLVETGPTLHYLSSERDLVALGHAAALGHGLLALGGANFDRSAPVPAWIEASLERGAEPSETRRVGGAQRSECGEFASLRFDRLPGTVPELRSVVQLWQRARASGVGSVGADEARWLAEDDATETAFKRLGPGRRVVHLATHGFFLGESCPSMLHAEDLTSDRAQAASGGSGENPLLLSGLALAGANRRDRIAPEADDGILTAEEIASLDLSGVEWVVLSACNTGVGKVVEGEGVFGLRRAFQIAGVRTLTMSLWKVRDRVTAEWMRALYEARLTRRLGTAEAVKEASLTILHELRNAGRSTHPNGWAAFIAAGDWR